jgi:hypothetical protein
VPVVPFQERGKEISRMAGSLGERMNRKREIPTDQMNRGEVF